MDYIRFGNGKKVLIMLPGLGDGLQTVKGTVLPMALMYRQFAKDYTVYMFSRKEELPQGYTTREMARDRAAAMEQLNIPNASILGTFLPWKETNTGQLLWGSCPDSLFSRIEMTNFRCYNECNIL